MRTKPIPVLYFLALVHLVAGSSLNADEPLVKKQVEATFETTISVNYWLYLPPDYETKEAWPLVVFLHGAGERGDDLEKVKTHGPPKEIAAGKSFPFIVVAPQCPRSMWWSAGIVNSLTRQVADEYKVDKRRIYLTGLSMGGFGTWSAAAEAPELYAALAPICGGGDPETAAQLKDLPIWVFHGAKDEAVPLRASQDMVDALQAAGSAVKFTVYPEAGHDSWTESYQNPALYEWMLSKSRP